MGGDADRGQCGVHDGGAVGEVRRWVEDCGVTFCDHRVAFRNVMNGHNSEALLLMTCEKGELLPHTPDHAFITNSYSKLLHHIPPSKRGCDSIVCHCSVECKVCKALSSVPGIGVVAMGIIA